MIKPWVYRSTQDKLLIFVSSSLQECKEERSIARDAIERINHQPVLFEHLGARPYSARDLYLSRLRDSQFMVAIYRSGYGYIDVTNGMEVSGLEEEFRFAREHGIRTIIYIHHPPRDRDPRLVKMIEEIKSVGHALSFYSDPKDLRERIPDDLTALITGEILSAAGPKGVLKETAKDVLAGTLDRARVVIPRTELIRKLDERLQTSPRLCLYGPPGIGKTTLAAQFAHVKGAIFVRVPGLPPRDLFAVCDTALRGGASAESRPYSTLEGARLGLATTWAETAAVTLVVDECDFVPELVDALSAGGGTSSVKRLVFTSRKPPDNYARFEVPPFTRAEADEMLAKRGVGPEVTSHLVEAGNPLELEQALLRSELGPETAGLVQIRGTAGELLRYLALSSVSLSAEDLLQLRADGSYSIDALSADIKRLGRFVEESPRGFRLMHTETASTIVAELRKSPQRFRFYVNRLIRLFVNTGDLRRVYELAALFNDGSEKQYALAVAGNAVRLGDWRLGVKLINQLLEEALGAESKAEAFYLMLSLVYPLELMGDTQRAATLLERARPLAEVLGSLAQSKLQETEISSKARRGHFIMDVAPLEGLYKTYGDRQQRWDQARIGLDLSAIYLGAKNFDQAVDILRPTLATFRDMGDDYGVDLAQRNLASALSSLPKHEEEAERLVLAIKERAGNVPDARRQRAWLCNILTRRLRRAGRHDEAEILAKEAIAIGESLGDQSLRAINQINLGNIYRDQGRPSDAIRVYEAAAVTAQKCGRRDVEAESSRLVAGILNDFPKIEGYEDRRVRARTYAQHAIGLLRGTLNYAARACALIELGEAQEALGELLPAARAFFEAAQDFSQVPDEDNYAHAVVRACSIVPVEQTKLYLESLAGILGVEQPNSGKALADQFIALVKPLIERSPRAVLIPLLGGHLHRVWSSLSGSLRSALVSAIISIVREFNPSRNDPSSQWRVLYAGVVLPYLLKDKSQPFLNYQLAQSITRSVKDVFVREGGDGSRIWTIVMSLGRRVTVSISPFDGAAETNVASFALAMFIKAFEEELRRELLGSGTDVNELSIQIGHIDHMPEDLRRLADQSLRLGEVLAKQACVVSRPSNFEESTPIFVFLGATFFDDIAFGEGSGGSLQMLFGLTLVELTFQLLKGQVEMEVIRPKVVSLVRRTLLL